MTTRRDILQIDYYEGIRDITDEQLELAFSGQTRELYEYVGDSVVHMIVTDMLLSHFSNPNMSPYFLTDIRGIIESNKLFAYMMEKRTLCKTDQSQFQLYKKGYTSSEKKCADTFEAIVGLFYVYLRSRHNSFKPLDIIHEWICDVFYLDKILDGLVEFKNAYDIVDELYGNTPRLSNWSEWSQCDKDRKQIRERKCLSGKCKDQLEERHCEGYSECDESGIRKKWNPETQNYEFDLCTDKSICDERGMRRSISKLTGEWEDEACPDYLYDKETRLDARCVDGYKYLYNKCKDKKKCVNRVITKLPCNESLVSLDNFKKLKESDKTINIRKGVTALQNNERTVKLVGAKNNQYANIMNALSDLYT